MMHDGTAECCMTRIGRLYNVSRSFICYTVIIRVSYYNIYIYLYIKAFLYVA
jgi:hypothetical protein